MRYAYLMLCEQEVLEQAQVSEYAILKMQDAIAAAGGGIAAMPVYAIFGGGDGGFGDGYSTWQEPLRVCSLPALAKPKELLACSTTKVKTPPRARANTHNDHLL